jgi:transcriptional regulator with XRE-family HTH domain
MHTNHIELAVKRNPGSRKHVTDDARGLRALRLMKGLSRKAAGSLCGVSARALEQLENGRCNVSTARLERYIKAIGYSYPEFLDVKREVHSLLPELERKARIKPPKTPKLKRNYHRIITKEVRVIRILRKRRGVSQYQAAKLCGYAHSIMGQIENGRIELPTDRLKQIVGALGQDWNTFEALMKSEVLRDELIEQCTHYLEGLDDNRLDSAATVIKALLK